MRVVIDTNVLLAGMATRGLCEGVLSICFESHTVILLEHILAEVREHYLGKFKANVEQADHAVATFRLGAELVEPAEVPSNDFDDVDDLPVLGTAVAGEADCLITGDRKLLELGQYMGVAILSPRAFYGRLRG